MPKGKAGQARNRAVEGSRAAADAVQTAINAIVRHCEDHSGFNAVPGLEEIADEVVLRLCDQLRNSRKAERAAKDDPISFPGGHPTNGMLLLARYLFDALYEYTQDNPRARDRIAQAEEWPVIIANDPSWDIRKVVKNPDGPAAIRYSDIIKSLGKATFWGEERTRKLGPFHDIAGTVAGSISRWLKIGYDLRGRGLPWAFDYPDGVVEHALQKSDQQGEPWIHALIDVSTLPRFGDRRQWAIAAKYYLHLTMSPEPWRTEIRKRWRSKREHSFEKFNPASPAEKELHRRIAQTPALPCPTDRDLELERLPFNEDANRSRSTGISERADFETRRPAWKADDWDFQKRHLHEPSWICWWRAYLQYEPNALFGEAQPFTESTEPAIRKLFRSSTLAGNPMSGFRRFVEFAIDTLLRLAGEKNGLKGIQKTGERLPRIDGVGVGEG